MNDCEHRSECGALIRCACLATIDIELVAGPANPNYPCDRCRDEWNDGMPPTPTDRSTWPPSITRFAEPLTTPTTTRPFPSVADLIADPSLLSEWSSFPGVLPPEAFAARLEICRSCPHWSADKPPCKLGCGCGGKPIHLAGDRCPKGKWH